MLKKLIVVYNPRSSKHAAVAKEVLEPARKLSGWLVGKFEVKTLGLHENADDLAKILSDGDLVIAAGGDGTAAMTANAVMRSEKDVTLGVLGYGNFNDLARMLKTKRAVEYGGEYVGGVTEIIERYEAGRIEEIYPLEAVVDGKHWRYAPCYLSLGLFAESTAVFDEPKVREKLKTGKKHMVFSIWTLAKWYFKNRKREFLPKGRITAMPDVVEVEKGREDEKIETPDIEDEKNEERTEVRIEPDVEKEFEAVKSDQDAGQRKFKGLLKAAKKQQLIEMRAGAHEKILKAGAQTKAKIAIAKTGAQTKLLNAKIKTRDKMVVWGEKVREKREQEVPEIIIGGAEEVERRKGREKENGKKNVACAVEKAQDGRRREFKKGATDYIAVNGPTVAKLMRGGKCYKKTAEFRSVVVRLGSFWRLMGFMFCSMFLRLPGKKTRGDVIKFRKRGNVMIQAEGEYEMLEGVRKIVVRKAKRGLKVVRG